MSYKKFNNKKNNKNSKKNKYTQAEKIAFRMGQENRVFEGLKNPDSRVYEAYCKGLNGSSTSNKKSLF